MLENISDLRLFIEVARHRQISSAGKALDMSPAVASKRLQRLETSLGQRLFNRTTRQISLTEDGRRVYEQVINILEEIDDLGIQAETVSAETLKGRIRLTSPISFGLKYVVPCLAEFLRTYPLVKIDVILDDMRFDLLQKSIDLAITIVPLHASNFIVRKLATNKKILVAGKTYVQQYGQPDTIEQLEKHDALILGNYRRWTLININTRKQTTILMRGNFRSNSGEATVAAAKAGLGICIKSLWDVADDLKTGDLVHILPDYLLFDDVDINIVFPTNKHLPLRNRMLLEFLVRELSGLIPA
jgi:DNA-binding transcriptional LysR family regulator